MDLFSDQKVHAAIRSDHAARKDAAFRRLMPERLLIGSHVTGLKERPLEPIRPIRLQVGEGFFARHRLRQEPA